MLTHIDKNGNVKMVDVSQKISSRRMAQAEAFIYMNAGTLNLIKSGEMKKGNVFTAAKIAGILAAKNTGMLIPLCHSLNLSSVDICFETGDDYVKIVAETVISAQTGVEMEALTAVSVAALTIYDMCKAVDRGMKIDGIKLVRKEGGKTFFMCGTVTSVNVSEKKGTKKKPCSYIDLREDFGIIGDCHAKSGINRQVSLLAEESIDKMRKMGVNPGYGDFAENITVKGVELLKIPIGGYIKIGKEVVLEMSQIGKECHSGCEISRQVGTCVMPTEGVFGKVVHGGRINVGDEVQVCIKQQ